VSRPLSRGSITVTVDHSNLQETMKRDGEELIDVDPAILAIGWTGA
jgi:hypothetical protein